MHFDILCGLEEIGSAFHPQGVEIWKTHCDNLHDPSSNVRQVLPNG